MTHLGTFTKSNADLPPQGLITTLIIVGLVLVAVFSTVACYRLSHVGKIQAQDLRV